MDDKPPDSELLVDESWLLHGGVRNVQMTSENGRSLDPAVKFGFVTIRSSSEFDHLGVDRFLNVKVRGQWEWVAIQVKTSNNGETVGVVLPIRNPFPPKLAARMSPGMIHRINAHEGGHVTVGNMLFVDAWGSLTNKKWVLEEIWRETNKIIDVRYKRLTGRYVGGVS